MRRRRVLAVRVVAVAAVAVTSIVFALSGPRLRAQNPEPLIVQTEVKEAPQADPLPTRHIEIALPQTDPLPTRHIEIALPPAPIVPIPVVEVEPTPLGPEPTYPVAEPPLTPSRVLPTPSTVFADPEAAANGFVERTTKEADEAVRALTKEAETLRSRLQKVEAGLSRWQSVKAALESNGRSGHAAWRSTTPTGGQSGAPDILEAIPGPVVEPPIHRSRRLPALPHPTASPFELDSLPQERPAVLSPATPEPDPKRSDTVSPPPIAPTPAPKPDPASDKQ